MSKYFNFLLINVKQILNRQFPQFPNFTIPQFLKSLIPRFPIPPNPQTPPKSTWLELLTSRPSQTPRSIPPPCRGNHAHPQSRWGPNPISSILLLMAHIGANWHHPQSPNFLSSPFPHPSIPQFPNYLIPHIPKSPSPEALPVRAPHKQWAAFPV